MTLARVGAMLLLAVALVTATTGDVHGAEPRRPARENFISRAVFASQRLWLLTDSGELSSIMVGEKVRVPVPLPEPALDLCISDGRMAALTCRRDACEKVTFRRWTAVAWKAEAPVALEGDRVAALSCSTDGYTILTSQRLIESRGGQVSVRRLSYPGKAPKWLVTSLLVTENYVFAGINAGEWGGGLLRVDRKTGAVTRIEKNATGGLCGGPLNTNCDPVNALAAEPWKPGCITAAVGLVHFTPHGRLVEICGDDVRGSYEKVFGSAGKNRPRAYADTVAFYGLTRVGKALLASGIDGLYSFDGSPEPRFTQLPKFDLIGGVGVSFAVPNTVLVLTGINQRLAISSNVPLLVSRIPESKPYPWFDATFPKLPKLGTVAEAPARWRTVQTKDGLSMRLGEDYVPRNDSCWETHTDKWPGPGWKDVCIRRTDRELLQDHFVLGPAAEGDRAPSSNSREIIDLVTYDSWRAGAAMLRGRRAIVETARGNGGMAGHKRERTMQALFEVGPGEWVRFSGRTGDDAGYDELLSIASTVEAALP